MLKRLPLRLAALSFTAVALVTMAALPGYARRGDDNPLPPLVWGDSIDKAVEKAKRVARPLMIHLCPPGKMARNEDYTVFDNDDVKALSKYFVLARIDPGNASDLVDKYKPEDFPVIVFADANLERLYENIEGHASFTDVIKAQKTVIKKAKPLTPENEAKIEAYMAKAKEYVDEERYYAAVKYYERIIKIEPRSGLTEEAERKIKEMEDEVAKIIERAEKMIEEGKKTEARDLLRKTAKSYRGLENAEKADDMAKNLKKEVGLTDREVREKSEKLFKLAKLYEENKMPEKAVELYRELLKKYPESRYAEEARARLAALEAGK